MCEEFLVFVLTVSKTSQLFFQLLQQHPVRIRALYSQTRYVFNFLGCFLRHTLKFISVTLILRQIDSAALG